MSESSVFGAPCHRCGAAPAEPCDQRCRPCLVCTDSLCKGGLNPDVHAPPTTERIRFAPYCRQGAHDPIDHHSLITCECPCHGGNGPWWADIRPEVVERIAASMERHAHILDRLDNGHAETPPKSDQNGSDREAR
jgi:hypothetical protein